MLTSPPPKGVIPNALSVKTKEAVALLLHSRAIDGDRRSILDWLAGRTKASIEAALYRPLTLGELHALLAYCRNRQPKHSAESDWEQAVYSATMAQRRKPTHEPASHNPPGD